MKPESHHTHRYLHRQHFLYSLTGFALQQPKDRRDEELAPEAAEATGVGTTDRRSGLPPGKGAPVAGEGAGEEEDRRASPPGKRPRLEGQVAAAQM